MTTERHVAHYLVSAVPKHERLEELGQRLSRAEFMSLRPFGATLTQLLKNAPLRTDGVAVWEENYCRPPLVEERAAVLDDYFQDLRVERVDEGEGWSKIEAHPRLFPDLAPL